MTLLLEDAFDILSFEELRFAGPVASSKPGVPAAPAEEEEEGVSVEGVTRRLLAQLARKNAIENVVPVLLALKRQLGE